MGYAVGSLALVADSFHMLKYVHPKLTIWILLCVCDMLIQPTATFSPSSWLFTR